MNFELHYLRYGTLYELGNSFNRSGKKIVGINAKTIKIGKVFVEIKSYEEFNTFSLVQFV